MNERPEIRPDPLAKRLERVRQRIHEAEQQYHRPAGSVELLAVSKFFPASTLQQAIDAGQQAFGESYLQEALEKIRTLSGQPLCWHFIGPIQSNKTRQIAAHFDWVHGVDRLKIAQRLSEQRPEYLLPLNICLQVNISGEDSKSGARPQDIPALAEHIARLPRLRLRGLMAIPAASDDFDTQLAVFTEVKRIFDNLSTAGHAIDTLSMGMSDDLEAAIAAGSTLVRIGTAIFGERG